MGKKRVLKLLILLVVSILFNSIIDVFAEPEIDYEYNTKCQNVISNSNLFSLFKLSVFPVDESFKNFSISVDLSSESEDNIDKEWLKILKELRFKVYSVNDKVITSNDDKYIVYFGHDAQVGGQFVTNAETQNEEMKLTLMFADDDSIYKFGKKNRCAYNIYFDLFVDNPKSSEAAYIKEETFTTEVFPAGSDLSVTSISTKCQGHPSSPNRLSWSDQYHQYLRDHGLTEKQLSHVQLNDMEIKRNVELEKQRYNEGKLTIFERDFCIAYDQHKKNIDFSGDKTYTRTEFDGTEYEISLKCDKNKYVKNPKNDEEYYQNAVHYYGSGESTKTFGYYTYHYAPDVEPVSQAVSCKVKCEEVISVEYGAPVMSLAGVCFEYKVRVTSRVSCDSSIPNPPNSEKRVCTSWPICYHGNSTYLQGGPSEDFDDCIKACDGGKYTEKCSKKCYNKVYKNKDKSSNKLTFEIAYSTKAKKMADGDSAVESDEEASKFSKEACIALSANSGYGGCYILNSDKSVSWYTGSDEMVNIGPSGNNGYQYYRAGRWYIEYQYYHKYYGGYSVTQNDGFYRHGNIYSYCHDRCYWYIPSNCKDGYGNPTAYMNYGFAEMDWEHNKTVYETAINDCKASASCATSTAEITMSVDYYEMVDGNKVIKSINFPYESNPTESSTKPKDSIPSRGNKTFVDTSTLANTTVINKKFLEYIPYNYAESCYTDGEAGNRYRLEFSFPGSWENRKGTGFVYTPQDASEHIPHPHEFCLPEESTKNVNVDWYKYMISKDFAVDSNGDGIYEDYNLDGTSLADSEIQSVCPNSNNYLVDLKALNNSEAPDPEFVTRNGKSEPFYNIHAIVDNFGLFEWDLNVDCFYAKYTSGGNPPPPSTPSCDPTPSETAYRVRTVDLTCLFPTKNGCDSYVEKSTTTGTDRIKGFNWTDYATVNKDFSSSGYTSMPSFIAKQIESKGYSIYTDEAQLDYEFKITPQIIREVKDLGGNYSRYQGTYYGVKIGAGSDDYIKLNIYSSDAFRKSGLGHPFYKAAKHIPGENLLVCNNMYNATSASGSCEQTAE